MFPGLKLEVFEAGAGDRGARVACLGAAAERGVLEANERQNGIEFV